MMDASCYVPNNPQYGLQLECQWNGVNAAGPTVHQLTSQHLQQQHHTVGTCAPVHCNGIIQHGGNETDLDPLSPSNQGCWTTPTGEPGDDMGSFSMPLDLDPLPTLFPFSPCASGVYKTESNCSPTVQSHQKEKPVHDMADVLLSLKHAVVHPGQTIDAGYHHHHQQQQPQQLSYTVHPHQMLMSPNGYAYCDQLPPPSYQTTTGHQQIGGLGGQVGPGPPPPMFPSMSVNVSMNMTYHPSTIPGYDQVQWGTTPQTTSPGYVQNQGGLLSPSYAGGATYSFTADFRPPNVQDVPLISSSSFKPIINTKAQFPPIRNVKKMEYVSPGKMHMVCQEDESQRPNLCRICGKTYARPSTLKTHLRTHSGEKPYRCLDCNKSFSQAANLTAHVRTHSGEKPFRCPICDRRFSQSSSVTTHMRTHSGERPYRCRMCKKAFSDSSTLTKHLRIHSGEKPYQCKLCLLRFSQSGNLNRHMRVHGTNNQMLV